MASTRRGPLRYTRLLISCDDGTFRNADTSSMLFWLGVLTDSTAGGGAVGAGGSLTALTATSRLAAYSQLAQATITSSPLCTSTWNSSLLLPPMLPESAR